MSVKLKKYVASLFLSLALSSAAAAETWSIVKTSGQVWIGSRSVQPVALGSETTLQDGAVLVTGSKGRVMLARGAETIVVSPNSHITLPGSDSGKTTILQRAGNVLFDVDKRTVQHFSVETPLLAAVVKGTKFQVDVGSEGAVVKVSEGSVEVQNLYTGETFDVMPAQQAAVRGPAAGLSVSGVGASPTNIRQGQPRAPRVHPLDAQQLHEIQARSSGTATVSSLVSIDAEVGDSRQNVVALGSRGSDGGDGDGTAGGSGGDGPFTANESSNAKPDSQVAASASYIPANRVSHGRRDRSDGSFLTTPGFWSASVPSRCLFWDSAT